MWCKVYMNGCPIIEKFYFKETDNKNRILRRVFKSKWEQYKDVHMEYKSHMFDTDSLVIWE